MRFTVKYDSFNRNAYIEVSEEYSPLQIASCDCESDIPADKLNNIKCIINRLIPEDSLSEINSLSDEIEQLIEKRRHLIKTLKSELKPHIISTCENFKYDYPEYYL